MKIYKDVTTVTLTVNQEEREVVIRPQDTLLRVLRENLGLTGTKSSCENGDCGACTVQVNGKAMKSCLVLAVETIHDEITTIEGIDNTALQASFVTHQGFQCGCCTAGMIVNADSLLKETPSPTQDQARVYMESNLCRCTGYEGIEAALTHVCQDFPRGLP